MDNLNPLVWLMAAAILLVGLAQKLQLSYPLVLIFGGAIIGFFPGVNAISFDPNLILVIVLPPLLYHSAYSLSFEEFKLNFKEIFSLALGLVIATTLVVGLLFKWLFPEFPWALAFAFGAIVSPPDAVAASAILKKFTIKTRLITVLEGESLINDASGLVLYKLAVGALLSGTFSLSEASFEFIKITVGGGIIGLIMSYLCNLLSSRFFDSIVAAVFSFILPYILFILADAFNVSGILAVVVGGLIGSHLFKSHFSSLTRVVSWASWDILIIFLNCFVFMLIGSQLSRITENMSFQQLLDYSGYGFLMTIAILFVRLVWVYTNEGLKYLWLKNRKKKRIFSHMLRDATILGWSGMRGIVSLTAVLALPLNLSQDLPLPGRDIVVFFTFIVIFLTLLIPSLSLTPLIHWLKIPTDQGEFIIRRARRQLAKVAENKIQHLHAEKRLDDNEFFFLLTYFNARHRILEISSNTEVSFHRIEWVRREIVHTQREHLLEMREQHEIEDKLLNLLERELDVEEIHLPKVELK